MKGRYLLLSMLSVAIFITSCSVASKNTGFSPSEQGKMEIEKVENASKLKKNQRDYQYNRTISVDVENVSVQAVIEGLCDAYKIPCSLTHKASNKHRITLRNYTGSLKSFLGIVKKETGLDYKFINNVLVLANYDKIRIANDNTPDFRNICKDRIHIAFERTPLIDVLKYFAKEYGYSFEFNFLKNDEINPLFIPESMIVGRDDDRSKVGGVNDDLVDISEKFQPLSGNKGKDKESKKDGGGVTEIVVTSFYTGCDPKESLYKIISSLDWTIVDKGNNKYEIRDFEQLIVDKSVFFDFSIGGNSSGFSGGLGASTSGGSSSMTNTSSISGSSSSIGSSQSIRGSSSGYSSDTFAFSESYRVAIEGYLKKFLSQKGRISFSPRGYIVVEDSPSRIKIVREILEKEIQKEEAIKINVKIIRVDLNDEYKAGVDWNLLIKESLGSVKNIKLSSNFSSAVNGVAFSADYKGLTNTINMLQQFGDVKLVKEFESTARSGLPISFKSVDQIPYATVNVQTGVQGNSSAFPQIQTVEAGLKILLLPNIIEGESKVDLSTSVEVSEYRGDKNFNLGETVGNVTVPLISTNRVVIPARINIGESMIITGFHINKKGISKQGIPLLSQMPVVGSLFGYHNSQNQDSELIIVITPEKVE